MALEICEVAARRPGQNQGRGFEFDLSNSPKATPPPNFYVSNWLTPKKVWLRFESHSTEYGRELPTIIVDFAKKRSRRSMAPSLFSHFWQFPETTNLEFGLML